MYEVIQMSERKLRKLKEILENQKNLLENKKEIKIYLGWKQLPYSEKSRINQEWNDYYIKIPNTPSYKDFLEQGKAWKKNNMKKVYEIARKTRKRWEERNFLPKPPTADPWEFNHGIYYLYEKICSQIQNINKKLTGVEDIEEIFS